MPENICAEKHLDKNYRQCPEQDDGEVSPLDMTQKEQAGENQPDKSNHTCRKVDKPFVGGEIPYTRSFSKRVKAPRKEPPPQPCQDRLHDEEGVFLDGNVADDDARDKIGVVIPDARGDQVVIPGGGVGDGEKHMHGNGDPYRLSVAEAVDLPALPVVPKRDGKEDQDGDEKEA